MLILKYLKISFEIVLSNYKMQRLVRIAQHAGSWYDDNPISLNEELQNYLA